MSRLSKIWVIGISSLPAGVRSLKSSRERNCSSRTWPAAVLATTLFSLTSLSASSTTWARAALSTTRVVWLALMLFSSSSASGERGLKPINWMLRKRSSGARLSSNPHAASSSDATGRAISVRR